MAESNTSTPSSGSPEEESGSSDEVDSVINDMESTTLESEQDSMSEHPNMAASEWDSDREYHESSMSTIPGTADRQNVRREEIRTTPLFSADVLAYVNRTETKASPTPGMLPQYSFLGKVLKTLGNHDQQDTDDAQSSDSDEPSAASNTNRQSSMTESGDSRLFVNMNAPWSAFICGSQGSGKSHTLSCMLEAALKPSQLGKLPRPLAGMVFHYDKFTGFSEARVCEAAYLCSTGIKVTVLVSSSNYHRMRIAYEDLDIPGLPSNAPRPVVAPLLLDEKHLNIGSMLMLMGVDGKDGKVSLYMESVCRILRSLAMKSQDAAGLNYQAFKDKLDLEKFNETQKMMLHTRLQLLESFMFPAKHIKWVNKDDATEKRKFAKAGIWSFEPGSLTIVDLSCPFVDESAACVMFNLCFDLFLKDKHEAGRIVALDEAHKYMTETVSSSAFTENLLRVIREQRHVATRVVIATQEPTISPALLDLSSMTIVHRFTSPAWHEALKSHLAAMSGNGKTAKRDAQELFRSIVRLQTGQAFVFAPSAMLGVDDRGTAVGGVARMLKLGTGYVKVVVRNRVTADGGRSVLAT